MCGFETSATLCGPHAYMLFYLAPALRPRVLMTLDEAWRPAAGVGACGAGCRHRRAGGQAQGHHRHACFVVFLANLTV